MSAGFDLSSLGADTLRGLMQFAEAVADGTVTISGTKTFDGSVTLSGAVTSSGGLTVTGALTPNSITGGDASLGITGQAATQGGAVPIAGGASSGSNNAGGAVSLTGGAGNGSGAGGAASVVGGASGAGATGNGGATSVTGGAAASTNGNGGSVVLTGGAKTGTGVAGMVITRSVQLVNQGAPTAKTVSATLTAAEVLAGIITVNQGAGATSAQQLPLATDMDTAMPDAAAGDAFDFSLINTSTVAAEDASITTNTGWTLVGNMDVASNAAATDKSAGRFRARKTGAGAWTLYRLS